MFRGMFWDVFGAQLLLSVRWREERLGHRAGMTIVERGPGPLLLA